MMGSLSRSEVCRIALFTVFPWATTCLKHHCFQHVTTFQTSGSSFGLPSCIFSSRQHTRHGGACGSGRHFPFTSSLSYPPSQRSLILTLFVESDVSIETSDEESRGLQGSHGDIVKCGDENGAELERSQLNAGMNLHTTKISSTKDTLPLTTINRRNFFQFSSLIGMFPPLSSVRSVAAAPSPEIGPEGRTNYVPSLPRGSIFEIEDPATYSAVTYIPPPSSSNFRSASQEGARPPPLPLIVILHGAGNNRHSALYEFTNTFSSPPGDHVQLPPCLLSLHEAPPDLAQNFVVVAPYVGKDKRSLYDESRGKIISFVQWFRRWLAEQVFVAGGDGGNVNETTESKITVDSQRMYLFGFSEGATLAIELATTRLFQGVVLASYGFTGTLPSLALDRLKGIPLWIFHSQADDVYSIQCSERLVKSLNGVITEQGGDSVRNKVRHGESTVRLTKLIPDSNEAGREHVRSAIVASKDADVYSWLLSLPTF